MYVEAKTDCHTASRVLVNEEEKCKKELFHFNNSKKPDCIVMWDHLNCWPPAFAGETISQPCPEFLKSDDFGGSGKVYRNCTVTGWTDPFLPHDEACNYIFNDTLHFLVESLDSHMYFSYVKAMYTAGYALSLISLTIAIAILCLFRKLHCTRNYIHIQLFISFILRAIFIFTRDSLLFANEDLYHCDHYTVACKLVLMASNYCILANYNWLLVEGQYLHTMVSLSCFSQRKHLCWYILLGWGKKTPPPLSFSRNTFRIFQLSCFYTGLPLIVIIFWGFAKYFYEDEGCWETRKHAWIWWILRVPVLLFILANLIFFLAILRIIVVKLRMSDAHGNEFFHYKRLIKSTFFLVALFGLQYILFVFLPISVSGLMFKIWTFAELALSSTQGFVVAFLYCFLNGEVQHEVARRWRRWRLKQRVWDRPRQHHGSLSQSGSAPTQVSLLPFPANTHNPPSTGHLPMDNIYV
ncbi:LOW QUALITY PROTEIN: secretin receptor [Aplochiton taeniatus]